MQKSMILVIKMIFLFFLGNREVILYVRERK
jgi:hypothetical protein